jgi:hypothetical protein
LAKNLFAEVFDNDPAFTTVTLLQEACPKNATTKTLCQKGETKLLTSDESNELRRGRNLGCRNPLGLDHILIGRGISSAQPAEHIAIGAFGGTKPVSEGHPDPLLAILDHCPLVAKLTLQ